MEFPVTVQYADFTTIFQKNKIVVKIILYLVTDEGQKSGITIENELLT